MLRPGVVVGLALAATAGCHAGQGAASSQAPDPATAPRVVFVTPAGDVTVAVEIADTPAATRRGLMFRRELARDAGMLFVFDTEEPRQFWMKNTYVPLDMIFVTAGLEVAGVVAGAEPLNETPVGVDKPSKYVIEVNAGFARERGIGPGTRVRLELPARGR